MPLSAHNTWRAIKRNVLPWAPAGNVALTIFCSIGAVLIADHNSAQREQTHIQKAAQVSDVTDYLSVTGRFDSAAQAYAGMILSSGKVDEKTRTELLANLVDQENTLDRVETAAGPKAQASIHAYKVALRGLSNDVQQVTGVADMAPYWQDLGSILLLRRNLDAAFKEAKHDAQS